MQRSLPRAIHLSLDDVVAWLRELSQGSWDSPWAHPGFALLKGLHERWGAAFSLYLFHADADGWDLSRMTSRHRDELAAARGWLRFGFHALDDATRYRDPRVSADDAAAHHDLVAQAVARFAGEASLDTVVRTHYFSGDRDDVLAWRARGVRGFLASDDGREADYHLGPEERAVLATRGAVRTDGLWFVRSVTRLERLEDVAAALDAADQPLMPVFTHEPLVDTTLASRLEAACAWAAARGVPFAFPMDVLPRT